MGDGPYTCCRCTASTWNDDDWCNACREGSRRESERIDATPTMPDPVDYGELASVLDETANDAAYDIQPSARALMVQASRGLRALIAEREALREAGRALVDEVFDAITVDGEATDTEAEGLRDVVKLARTLHTALKEPSHG